jgi:uncharacterized membrane protein YhiD involved in acid resistance
LAASTINIAALRAIGLDRELRQKSTGLRTYTLVGLGSALFMSSRRSTGS